MDTASSIPSYCSTPALRYLVKDMKNPRQLYNKNSWDTDAKHCEEDVVSWATTKLKKVFSGDECIISPQKKNTWTGKKPDLIVQKFEQNK